MTRGAEIHCRDVRFGYPGSGEMAFDFGVEAGGIVALMGSSGSGKSTLLALIAGFETPLSGSIVIGGRDVTRLPPASRPVSMVFQENNLFAHLDVESNVGLGLSPSLRLGREERQRIEEALASTGLAGKAKRLPAELSGGERQRVALARALLRDRPVLLLDEPFASLGPALRSDMLALLAELHQRRGMTVLMATHQPEDARAVAGRLLFLGDGRILADGDARDLLSPDGPETVRDYIGARKER